MGAITATILQQQKTIRLLEVKSELLDFKNEVRIALKNKAACNFNFQNKSFDQNKTGPDSLPVAPSNDGSLYLGADTSAIKITQNENHPTIRGFKVITVQMSNFREPNGTMPDLWLGDIQIQGEVGGMQLKALSIPLALKTTVSGTERQVVDCESLDSEGDSILLGNQKSSLGAGTTWGKFKQLSDECDQNVPGPEVPVCSNQQLSFFLPDGIAYTTATAWGENEGPQPYFTGNNICNFDGKCYNVEQKPPHELVKSPITGKTTYKDHKWVNIDKCGAYNSRYKVYECQK